MGILISMFIILTVVGGLRLLFTSATDSIESDNKYVNMPVSSLLQELKQSARDRLQSMLNKSSYHDIDFYEISYGSFCTINNLFQKTPLREMQFSPRDDGSQTIAVARFSRDQIDEPAVRSYLVLVVANGDIYEIITKITSEDKVVFLKNETVIGQLTRKSSAAKGLSRLLDPFSWDIFIAGQYWGELKNTGKVITWSSYKISNQDFPEGLPVKIREKDESFGQTLWKCVLLVGLFFTFWTLWPFWLFKTNWYKSKLYSVNEETVLLSPPYDLSPEQTEVYFLVSIFLRLLKYDHDFDTPGA